MTNLEIITTLTGCDDEALLTVLLSEAEERVLAMTGRTRLIDALNPAVRELAVAYYNRLGSEGMTSRSDSEVGISSVFEDIPKSVEQAIFRYRLARVSGGYYETNATTS